MIILNKKINNKKAYQFPVNNRQQKKSKVNNKQN